MRKEEAVDLLNEIMKICMLPRFIGLELSNPKAPEKDQSYELRIKGPFSAKDWDCLKKIVLKRDLSMKETADYLIVYQQKDHEVNTN